MALPTQLTLSQIQTLLQTQYAAAAAAANIPIANTGPGSSLGAILNADSALALSLQNELIYIDQISRLSTIPANPNGSPNPDVDTFCAPFGIYRLGATYASGQVVCSTPSPVSAQILVPVGVIFVTPATSSIGGIQFQVIADTTNVNYSSTLNAYPITLGNSSVSVTVQCLATGAIGNVAPSQITAVLGTSTTPLPPAVTSVNNPAAFTNGLNTESDAAFKARFTLTVSSGRVATINAIMGAALAVQAGLTVSIGDQVNASNVATPAYFTVVVNIAGQGTAPPSSLITSVYSAINAIRSAGISFQVIAPTLINVAASAGILIANGYTAASVLSACGTAYNNYVNGIGLAPDNSNTKCTLMGAYVALSAVPGVVDVEGLALNGTAADVTASFAHQLVAGTTSFTQVFS